MSGRKEVLTEQLARKIARMIERFPDAGIPVTWDSVIAHTTKRFGVKLKRNALSQKEFDGIKIIADAFRGAKGVQNRIKNDSIPKYKTATRTVLQQRIELLEAKNIELKEELELVRAQQLEALDSFLNTPRDIHALIEGLSTSAPIDEIARIRQVKNSEEK